MTAKFTSFGQVGRAQNDDQVLIDVLDFGAKGYCLRANRVGRSGMLLDSSVTFVPELLDTSLKFVDMASDKNNIMSKVATLKGHLDLVRDPRNGIVDISYSSGIELEGPAEVLDRQVAIFDGVSGELIKGGKDVFISPSGNLGIGVNDPTQKLEVNGAISSSDEMYARGYTVSKRSPMVYEIFSMNDFPSHVSGVITLPSGKYIIKNSLTTSNRFYIGSGSKVIIKMNDFQNNILTYTGSGSLFTGRDAFRFVLETFNILCININAKSFDVVGGDVIIDNGQIIMSGLNSTIGNITDGGILVFRNSTFMGYKNGIILTNPDRFYIGRVLMQGNLTGTGALFSIIGSVGYMGVSSLFLPVLAPGESAFYIDPAIIKSITIIDTLKIGTGAFFKAGSLKETSKYVTTLRNGSQKDSANIGSMVVGGNVAKTLISSPGTFVDLNLNGLAVEASDIELWVLTNITTGEMRYDGDLPVSLNFTGLIASSSVGGTQRFNFRLLKNGSPLPAPDNVDIPIEVKATIVSSALLWSIMASPGDKFRLQVAIAAAPVSTITIDTLKVIIS